MLEVVFWQTIVSPHMAGLAGRLAKLGCSVIYVAGRRVSPEREALGWTDSAVSGVRVIELDASGITPEVLVQSFPVDAVHVVQGLRRNGYIRRVITTLRQNRLRWGAVLETVNDAGVFGLLKRADYRSALRPRPGAPQFVLAIGSGTSDWISARQFPAEWSFPFCYFLAEERLGNQHFDNSTSSVFRIGYVGRLIKGKRVDLLIQALGMMANRNWHLDVVGSGPLEHSLKQLVRSELGFHPVRWHGALPMEEAKRVMSKLDCLVLPSDHDGWGAVISEALISGVPAICSDACGAAEVVRISGVGGVFPKGKAVTLRHLLEEQLAFGPLSTYKRESIAKWSRCLDAETGARYLMDIFEYRYSNGTRPTAPWYQMQEAAQNRRH